jgi:hypothetical protein
MATTNIYKSPRIVKNKIVLEKITFRGKKIIREKVIKEWNIPKIITSDIGYQLMFGNRCLQKSNNSNGGIEPRTLEY